MPLSRPCKIVRYLLLPHANFPNITIVHISQAFQISRQCNTNTFSKHYIILTNNVQCECPKLILHRSISWSIILTYTCIESKMQYNNTKIIVLNLPFDTISYSHEMTTLKRTGSLRLLLCGLS